MCIAINILSACTYSILIFSQPGRLFCLSYSMPYIHSITHQKEQNFLYKMNYCFTHNRPYLIHIFLYCVVIFFFFFILPLPQHSRLFCHSYFMPTTPLHLHLHRHSIQKITYYVEEVRERWEFDGEVTDNGAVYLRRNGTETTYYYYPSSGMMVEEQDGQCRQTGYRTRCHFV